MQAIWCILNDLDSIWYRLGIAYIKSGGFFLSDLDIMRKRSSWSCYEHKSMKVKNSLNWLSDIDTRSIYFSRFACSFSFSHRLRRAVGWRWHQPAVSAPKHSVDWHRLIKISEISNTVWYLIYRFKNIICIWQWFLPGLLSLHCLQEMTCSYPSPTTPPIPSSPPYPHVNWREKNDSYLHSIYRATMAFGLESLLPNHPLNKKPFICFLHCIVCLTKLIFTTKFLKLES